jgi:ABC-type transporter Mla subunit MlaD
MGAERIAERVRELFDRVPHRMLAPASLALFALVLLVVVVASLGGDGSGSSSSDSRTTSERPTPTRTTGQRRPDGAAVARRVYVVKPGDTLAQIAQQTEVPIERLIALNPTADPQSLVTGQRIKLRE